MKNKHFLPLIAALVFAAIILFSLFGCNTTKQDFKSVNKAILRSPVQTAKQLADKWPCIPLIIKKDSTEYKKYLKDLQEMQDFYNDHVPETMNIEADTIFKKWEDSTKIRYYLKVIANRDDNIKYLKSYVDTLTRLCAMQPAEIDSILVDGPKLFIAIDERDKAISAKDILQKRLDAKEKWLWWLAIITLLLLGYNIVRLYLKSQIKIV